MSSSEKRGLSVCATIITIICLITGVTLFTTGCIPSLEGTCPNYIHTHATLTGFHYKNGTRNIYASLVRDDNGKICNSLISENSPKLTLNVSTLYEYNIGSRHDIYIRKDHQTTCNLDFGDKANLNTISGIIFIIMAGIMFCVGSSVYFECDCDSCWSCYRPKRIHITDNSSDKILQII